MTWFSNAWFSRAAFCLMKNWHKAYVKNPVEVMTVGEVGEAAQLLCRREKNDGRMKQSDVIIFSSHVFFSFRRLVGEKSDGVRSKHFFVKNLCANFVNKGRVIYFFRIFVLKIWSDNGF